MQIDLLDDLDVSESNGSDGTMKSIFQRLKEFKESNMWLKIRMLLKVSTIVLVLMLLIVFTVQWFSLRISSNEPIQSKIGKISLYT
jgi:hypothetical protein